MEDIWNKQSRRYGPELHARTPPGLSLASAFTPLESLALPVGRGVGLPSHSECTASPAWGRDPITGDPGAATRDPALNRGPIRGDPVMRRDPGFDARDLPPARRPAAGSGIPTTRAELRVHCQLGFDRRKRQQQQLKKQQQRQPQIQAREQKKLDGAEEQRHGQAESSSDGSSQGRPCQNVQPDCATEFYELSESAGAEQEAHTERLETCEELLKTYEKRFRTCEERLAKLIYETLEAPCRITMESYESDDGRQHRTALEHRASNTKGSPIAGENLARKRIEACEEGLKAYGGFDHEDPKGHANTILEDDAAKGESVVQAVSKVVKTSEGFDGLGTPDTFNQNNGDQVDQGAPNTPDHEDPNDDDSTVSADGDADDDALAQVVSKNAAKKGDALDGVGTLVLSNRTDNSQVDQGEPNAHDHEETNEDSNTISEEEAAKADSLVQVATRKVANKSDGIDGFGTPDPFNQRDDDQAGDGEPHAPDHEDLNEDANAIFTKSTLAVAVDVGAEVEVEVQSSSRSKAEGVEAEAPKDGCSDRGGTQSELVAQGVAHLSNIEADMLLDKMIKSYGDTGKKPAAKTARSTQEAAARRWQALDDDRTDLSYQKMLSEKSQADRLWYAIVDLVVKDSMAAVTGLGASKVAGTKGHSKKCTVIAKKMARLDPSHRSDINMIDKLMLESGSLSPWTANLRKAMVSLEDVLLS